MSQHRWVVVIAAIFTPLSWAASGAAGQPAPGRLATRPATRRTATLPAVDVSGLSSPEQRVRLEAAMSLRRPSARLRVAATALAKAADDTDAEVRANALAALGEIYSERLGDVRVQADVLSHEQVVAVLMKALADQSPYVRRQAIAALGSVGLRAGAASGRLIEMLNDPAQAQLCDVLAEALAAIDWKALQGQLDEKKPVAVLEAALLALGSSGAKSCAGSVAKYLDAEDYQLKVAAISSLTRLFIADDATLAKLQGMISDRDDRVRASVIRAMAVMAKNDRLQAVLQTVEGDQSKLVRLAVGVAQRRVERPTTKHASTQSASKPTGNGPN